MNMDMIMAMDIYTEKDVDMESNNLIGHYAKN
jgi:hypothetical protein